MFEAHAQPVEPSADEPDTRAEAVQSDPGLLLDKIESWAKGFQRMLPNIAVALVVFLVFVGLGWGIQSALVR